MLRNLLLLLVSTLITLGALEVAIQTGRVPLPRPFESSGWWKEHWLRKRRGPVPREFVKIDPDLGWIPAPGLDRLPYQGAHLSTTSASIRGTREHAPGPADHPRIVAIGDSYVFGQCVDDGDTMPARLEALLPGAEVINLGVMGYGHGQMLERLRRDGLPFAPDVVWLGFFEYDLSRDRLSFRDYAKPRFVLDGGRLRLTHVPVGPPEEYEDDFPRLWNYAVMLHDVLRRGALVREERALGRALVEAMARESERAGARFALTYLPREEQVLDADAGRGPIPTGLVAELCAEHGWPCVDPRRAIVERWPWVGHRKDQFECHYSPALSRLVAEQTAAALRAAYPDLFGAPAAAEAGEEPSAD